MATKTDSRFLKVDGAFERPGGQNNISIITDPVTGNRYSRDLSIPGSTYETYNTPSQGAIGQQSLTGSQGGTLPSSPTQSSAQGISSNPMDTFNNLMLGLLNSAKGVNTADLLKRKRELERESISRTSAPTDRELRTLSPAQQSAIRSGSVNALSPELDDIQYKITKAQQSVDNFFQMFDRAQSISQEYAEKAAPPQESVDAMTELISLNPEKFDGIFGSLNQKGQDLLMKNLAAKNVSLTIPEKKSGGSGLTTGQINSTVNSIAGAFDNEPIVKAYNTVQEGYQTISSIGVNTKSPADDIAFIYAFAKIMDPNSVVREGEYNTIQKYAQTWAANFGFNAQRVFSNTNFLTSDAKQKMLNALTPKVTSITNQYDNLNAEYQRQINDAYAGKPRQITNYAAGNVPKTTTGNDPLKIR